jgi:hypothetical protein
MKRRTFIQSLTAGPVLASSGSVAAAADAAPPRWEKSAPGKREITSGIVWPNHEDLAFLLRRGGNSEAAPAARLYSMLVIS